MIRAVLFMILLIIAVVWTTSAQSLGELIQRADAAYARNFEETKLREAIALYEQALTLDANHRHSLNRLSQAYYELAFAYYDVLAEDRNRVKDLRKTAYAKGQEYGLRSLRLNSEFTALERKDWGAAVRAVSDVAALYWMGNNWGRVLEEEGASITNLGRAVFDAPKIRQSYERAVEVDEKYMEGGPRRSLGALLANLPGFLGGDLQNAKESLERAVQLGPDFFENHVIYAREYAVRARDRALFESLLTFVMQAPLGDKYILWNRVTKKEAQQLLAQIDSLFPK